MAFDFPNTPTTNQIVTMPDGTVRKWDGVKWVAGQTPVSPYCYTGDAPPSNPTPGTSWWDSVSCQLFVYYNDGNSSQWVPAVAIPASVGEAPSNSNYYARRNGQWLDIGSSQLQGNVGRNLIHNGMFNIWQRGGGPWTIGGYTADRWTQYISVDTCSTAIYNFNDTDRAQIGDEVALYMLGLTFTGTTGSTSQTTLLQRIENVRSFSGKTLTLSFWARNVSGSAKIGVAWSQNFGTGGSPSANITNNFGVTPTLTASFARYTLTTTLPSISGKTLGSNGNSSLDIQIHLSCATSNPNNTVAGGIGTQSGSINLWGVQLEIGSVATQLEKISIDDELRHCQRFYQTGYFSNTGYISNTGITHGYVQTYPVWMRATPTMTSSGTTAVNVSGNGLFPTGMHSLEVATNGAAIGGYIWKGTWVAIADL